MPVIRTVLVAAAAMLMGMALGVLLCRAAVNRLRRRVKDMQRRLEGGKTGKMGVMDKVLVLEAVTLAAYTVAALAVFWHTGSEPSTLTACVFGVCGLENGVMGWIKTSKDKAAEAARTDRNGWQNMQEEIPAERQEPPDAGL